MLANPTSRCRNPPPVSLPGSCLRALHLAAWLFWLICSTATLAAAAKAPTAGFHIGYLLLSPLTDPPSVERQAFLHRLARHGLNDGKELRISYRSANWDTSRLFEQALDLVNQDVDLIVAVSVPAAQAALRINDRIPVLFISAVAPLQYGPSDKSNRPRSLLTGVSLASGMLDAKRLDLIKEAYPHIRQVAILTSEAVGETDPRRNSNATAASSLGLTVSFHRAGSVSLFTQSMRELETNTPDAIVIWSDSRTLSFRKILADFGRRKQVPIISGLREFTDQGGLLSYGPRLPALYEVLADYSVRLLNGTPPAQLPVFHPLQFELIINLDSARALGRPIGSGVLFRADEVVE